MTSKWATRLGRSASLKLKLTPTQPLYLPTFLLPAHPHTTTSFPPSRRNPTPSLQAHLRTYLRNRIPLITPSKSTIPHLPHPSLLLLRFLLRPHLPRTCPKKTSNKSRTDVEFSHAYSSYFARTLVGSVNFRTAPGLPQRCLSIKQLLPKNKPVHHTSKPNLHTQSRFL
ncbi:hypothetical protein DFS34DRAFT_626911 [Phlyctochytrium arcticum]|nr:hypothetical protein DFS34DRAFT_626911 [Phlyctochytrium arcticum]